MYLCVYTCCLSVPVSVSVAHSLSLSLSVILPLFLFVCIDGADVAEKCELNCRTAAALNWKYSTNRSNVQFAQTQTPASTHTHPHTYTHTHRAHMHASIPCSKYSSAAAAILNLIVGKDEKLRRFTKVLPEFRKLHLQSATPPFLYPFSVAPLSTPSLYPLFLCSVNCSFRATE